jgi:hypothetical protein
VGAEARDAYDEFSAAVRTGGSPPGPGCRACRCDSPAECRARHSRRAAILSFPIEADYGPETLGLRGTLLEMASRAWAPQQMLRPRTMPEPSKSTSRASEFRPSIVLRVNSSAASSNPPAKGFLPLVLDPHARRQPGGHHATEQSANQRDGDGSPRIQQSRCARADGRRGRLRRLDRSSAA